MFKNNSKLKNQKFSGNLGLVWQEPLLEAYLSVE